MDGFFFLFLHILELILIVRDKQFPRLKDAIEKYKGKITNDNITYYFVDESTIEENYEIETTSIIKKMIEKKILKVMQAILRSI